MIREMKTSRMVEPLRDEQTVANEVMSLVQERPLTIATDADLQEATAWLARVRQKRKDVEEFFGKLIRPFREAISQHKTECDAMLAPLREHESALQDAVKTYRQDQARKAAEAQRKAVEQHQKRVEKAVEKGKDPALVKPPPVVATPAKSVETEAGKMTFRSVRKYKIRDPLLVPKEYWVIDESRVGKAVRAGIDVPGCDIWTEEVPSYRAD